MEEVEVEEKSRYKEKMPQGFSYYKTQTTEDKTYQKE